MIWTLWIQIGQPYRKVLCNKPAHIIAWKLWMWSADFKLKFLPKTPFELVECIIENRAKIFSHEVQKVFRGVRENQRTVYFQIFFLEFILWIRKKPFWQLCSELLGKTLKLSLPKSINDSIYLFLHNLFPQKILLDTFPPKIWGFFPDNRKLLNSFSPKHFYGKLLVWTRRTQLWWYLRHFPPESPKSSAQIQKLMEKNEFNLKVFSFENLLWTHRVQFWLTFRIFWTEAQKSLAQNQKLMGKTFSGEKVLLLWKSLKL